MCGATREVVFGHQVEASSNITATTTQNESMTAKTKQTLKILRQNKP